MSVFALFRSLIVNNPRNIFLRVRCGDDFGQIATISYGPYFIEPVVSKHKQEECLKSGEAQKLKHVPIKAALNFETCSVFHDELTRKFTNRVMKCGNKNLARKLMERTFENIKRIQLEKYHKASEETKEDIILDPVQILHNAVSNTRPLLELTPIKRGGVRYQVPVPVTEKRSQFLGIRYLIEAGQDKERNVHFPEKLARELIDAATNQGYAVKRKVDLHKQCENNKAYAHYRWS